MSIIEELNEHEKRQLEIMDFYNSGYTYEEIAKFMFMSVNTIKTIVNTWIKNLPSTSQEFVRNKHRIEKKAKKETVKAINYEATREMGDKAFILKNRSIYKTKENGNIILKSENELECKVTWDTPRRLNNDSREEKREEFKPTISTTVGQVVSSHYSKEMSNTRLLSNEERKIIYNSNYLN
ncbi:transcriptional regulator [Clostridium perfringens]|uniref:Transcriptional regulator n=1 Tax=Clostridium perfringens TaxID=1502 RepID=A0A2X3KDE9_CLOPF|nr:response regulator transcription factor [Clostridium perfringens]SQC85510.1 transcriptional regulator [Clostridium perfringens]